MRRGAVPGRSFGTIRRTFRPLGGSWTPCSGTSTADVQKMWDVVPRWNRRPKMTTHDEPIFVGLEDEWKCWKLGDFQGLCKFIGGVIYDWWLFKVQYNYFEDIRNKWAQERLPTYNMLLLFDVFGIIMVYLIITNPWTGNLPWLCSLIISGKGPIIDICFPLVGHPQQPIGKW